MSGRMYHVTIHDPDWPDRPNGYEEQHRRNAAVAFGRTVVERISIGGEADFERDGLFATLRIAADESSADAA
ncbi:MAG: hypothetical protein ABSB37_19440 [Xanthobacteraceae bacterium]|jgi:hypothetical protein|uniref:hypothetical protein n=1 Tax=Candidatus Binatus sp. TaxID=2811406 RepID=UPI003D1090A1